MLVLTRKRHQTIRIGDQIVIKVLRTGTGSVKLGIEAPADVRVLRAELCDRSGAEPGEEAETAGEPGDFTRPAVACSDQFPQPYVA